MLRKVQLCRVVLCRVQGYVEQRITLGRELCIVVFYIVEDYAESNVMQRSGVENCYVG